MISDEHLVETSKVETLTLKPDLAKQFYEQLQFGGFLEKWLGYALGAQLRQDKAANVRVFTDLPSAWAKNESAKFILNKDKIRSFWDKIAVNDHPQIPLQNETSQALKFYSSVEAQLMGEIGTRYDELFKAVVEDLFFPNANAGQEKVKNSDTLSARNRAFVKILIHELSQDFKDDRLFMTNLVACLINKKEPNVRGLFANEQGEIDRDLRNKLVATVTRTIVEFNHSKWRKMGNIVRTGLNHSTQIAIEFNQAQQLIDDLLGTSSSNQSQPESAIVDEPRALPRFSAQAEQIRHPGRKISESQQTLQDRAHALYSAIKAGDCCRDLLSATSQPEQFLRAHVEHLSSRDQVITLLMSRINGVLLKAQDQIQPLTQELQVDLQVRMRAEQPRAILSTLQQLWTGAITSNDPFSKMEGQLLHSLNDLISSGSDGVISNFIKAVCEKYSSLDSRIMHEQIDIIIQAIAQIEAQCQHLIDEAQKLGLNDKLLEQLNVVQTIISTDLKQKLLEIKQDQVGADAISAAAILEATTTNMTERLTGGDRLSAHDLAFTPESKLETEEPFDEISANQEQTGTLALAETPLAATSNS